MKNASASGSSNSQMLPNLLPLSASFFKVLPQKFNRFHISGWCKIFLRAHLKNLFKITFWITESTLMIALID